MDLQNKLNEAQLKAAQQTEGPVMIIAGPGSGKTRVLTYRIAYMLFKEIDPFSIMALTFTNKAASEMRHRIEELVGNNAKSLFMGTFHSVFARLLRVDAQKMGYPSNFTIYDTNDSISVLKNVLKEMELNDKIYKPKTIFNRISSAKNALIGPDEYMQDDELVSDDYQAQRPLTGEVYKKYVERCFKSGAMDFDDLLFKTHELISNFPDVLYKYQHRFRYFMIDEFQDTNPVQYQIVKKLASVHENICVVGDDAQSIYAFRGATIENILNFKSDYPDLQVFKLEQNYRSTKNIVSAANHLIVKNKNQLPKTIWTDNVQGEPIILLKAGNDNEEARMVVSSIFELKMREHLRNRDFAILYRTNSQSRAFEESLRRMNIPYIVYGGLSFYQRKEIKDLLAYLRLIVNQNDEEAFTRIVNYPVRGIGKTSIEKMMVLASENDKTLWQIAENIFQYGFPSRTAQLIAAFINMIKSFQTLLEKKNAYDLALHVANATQLLKELADDKSVEGLMRYENIQQLLNGIKEFTVNDTIIEGEEFTNDRSLGAYLQNISLLTNDDSKDPLEDSVKLMTIHAAKGLEFPVVYVGGMEEGLFPSSMSLYSREDLEEERRLFYVAVTRAEKHLFLSFAGSRFTHGKLQFSEPSRFIEDVPEEIIKLNGELKFEKAQKIEPPKRKIFVHRSAHKPEIDAHFEPDSPEAIQVGQLVLHQRFGNGKVNAIDGMGPNRMATIYFEEGGPKKVMLKFAKLKILE